MNIYLSSADKIFGAGSRNRLQFNIPILNEGKYPKYNPDYLMKVINVAKKLSNKLTYFRFDCKVKGKKGAETDI